MAPIRTIRGGKPALVALMLAMALGLVACQPSQTPSTTARPTAPADFSGHLTLGHFFTGDDADAVQATVDSFESLYTNVTVSVIPGLDDDELRSAITAGRNMDVAITYSSDQIGPLCSSGTFNDLTPYIQADNIDMGQIPSIVASYTQFGGSQCALPMLTDATGLYYNKALFDAAGIAGPPKTLDELAADAKALTTHNKDGSIKTLGFMPLVGYYETNQSNLAAMAGAKWLNSDGTSAIGSDTAWTMILQWQKKLIDDLGGFKALDNWMALAGDEFSPQNDFETGRLAMQFDGDWRVSMIADEAPSLTYGTSPLPTASPDFYGGGVIDGNIIGIPKGSTDPALAWELVKYLALNTDTQVQLANQLNSLPTINSAATSLSLEVSPQYQVFLDVLRNAHSVTEPRTTSGTQYADIMATFMQNWQSGLVSNLADGLADVDQEINSALSQG